jgi:hypothetical protein
MDARSEPSANVNPVRPMIDQRQRARELGTRASEAYGLPYSRRWVWLTRGEEGRGAEMEIAILVSVNQSTLDRSRSDEEK